MFRCSLRFHRALMEGIDNIEHVSGSRLLGAGGSQTFIVAISLGPHRGQVPGDALGACAAWWVA